MKGLTLNLHTLVMENTDFRQVLFTTQNCQLVVMALKPGEELGSEVHLLDQLLYVVSGTGEAVLDEIRSDIRTGFAIIVPAGVRHNLINTGNDSLHLYTLYSPPNHRKGVVHVTRADAENDHEHFDGKTSE